MRDTMPLVIDSDEPPVGNPYASTGSLICGSLLARATEVSPEQAAPKHFLGRALLQDGRTAEAQPYLLQAVAMDPKVWDYHYWLAQSLERNGNLPSARAQYQEALRLNPESGEAKLRLTAMEGK